MEKRVIVKAEGLRKTFKLSKKQQTIQKTKDKVKVAVDCLDFEAYEGEIFGIPNVRNKKFGNRKRILAPALSGRAYQAIWHDCFI